MVSHEQRSMSGPLRGWDRTFVCVFQRTEDVFWKAQNMFVFCAFSEKEVPYGRE